MMFEEAANTLQKEVHRVFPFANAKGKCGVAKISTMNEEEEQDTCSVHSTRRNNSIRGRTGGGRGHGRGGRGGRNGDNDRVIVNGVDITDATHTFSSQEWARLRGHYNLVSQRCDRAHAAGRATG